MLTDPSMRLDPVPSWDLGQTYQTFSKGTFHGVIMGVEIQKCDDDLERYRDLIERTQPDIVIETGTRAGGSALWFHHEMHLQVVSIDIASQFTRGEPHVGPGISWVRGSSIHPETIEQVLPLIRGKRVMVSLDADHHSAHVQAEMSTWGPFVTPGCYMVVEDACFDLFERAGQSDWARIGGGMIPEYGGTLDAIEHSGIARSPEWERDTFLEGITPISHSPVGYWWKHD